MRCLVLLIALAAAACGHDPSGPSPAAITFKGTVSDVDTGGPIKGASIFFIDASDVVRANAGLTAMTDSNGVYGFNDVTLGGARLTANAVGYAERRTGLIDIRSGVLNWQLRRIQTPITFTGQVDDRSPDSCGFVSCSKFSFSMRRSGSVDVTLTWAAGTDLTVEVVGGLVTGEQGASGNAGTLHVSPALGASGDYGVWVVNSRLARGPIAFTVTLIIAD